MPVALVTQCAAFDTALVFSMVYQNWLVAHPSKDAALPQIGSGLKCLGAGCEVLQTVL